MGDGDERFWDGYWSEATPTVMARTMTAVLDRIKLEYLQFILPPTGCTLEVGSGSARLSCLLAMAGYRTVCVDISMRGLVSAQANYSAGAVSGWFVAGDGFRLPFPDGTFDVVLSTGLLEHFEDPSQIVLEMVRVLRARGVFYSDIVPRKFSLFRSLQWVGQLKGALIGRAEPAEKFHERSFTARQILDLLERCGLVGARVFPAGVVPPYLPLLHRSRRLRESEVRFVERTRTFWKRLDGTRLAEWLGFYYFAWGTKP